MKNAISILILTKNESVDIAECIQSVSWSDDIHILDSYSTDTTIQIAEKFGAKITQRKFDTFSAQRNFGLHQLVYKYEWLIMLDADERIPAALANEITQFIYHASHDVAAARIRRRDFWWGHWLKHAAISPFNIRIVRPARVHFVREINEVLVVDGKIQDLHEYFDHYSFSKGLVHWIDKHNLYSNMEAELIARGNLMEPSLKTALFSNDMNQRRLHQKAIFYRLPGRPLIKFIYMFFIRRSFLDGWPGIRYTLLQCIYEYFIVLKTKEMMRINKSKTA